MKNSPEVPAGQVQVPLFLRTALAMEAAAPAHHKGQGKGEVRLAKELDAAEAPLDACHLYSGAVQESFALPCQVLGQQANMGAEVEHTAVPLVEVHGPVRHHS